MSKTAEESNACIKKMHGLDQCNELCEGCFAVYKCGIPDQYSQSKIQEHQAIIEEKEREINELKMSNMTHEYNNAEAERFFPELKKQIEEPLKEKIQSITEERDDYREVVEDKRRLVREIDVIMNGENAAKQASLCDIIPQIKEIIEERDKWKELAEAADRFIQYADKHAALDVSANPVRFENLLDIYQQLKNKSI